MTKLTKIKLAGLSFFLLINLSNVSPVFSASPTFPKGCDNYYFQGTKSSLSYDLTDKGCAQKTQPLANPTKESKPNQECLLFGFLHCELALIIVIVIILLIILTASLFKRYKQGDKD